MAKESWKIVVLTAGLLHCVGASSSPEDMANPEGMLTASASAEAKTSKFHNPSLIAENRQGYYHRPNNEGSFLNFIADSANIISDMFLDSTTRSWESSGTGHRQTGHRPHRVRTMSRYPPSYTGADRPFFHAPKFRSFPHDPPPPLPPPAPRSERSPLSFNRYRPPPTRRHSDFRRDPYRKNSGYWTGSYSSHFKLFDSDDITDTLQDEENNLIDRRHTSSESFSVNNRNELRTSEFDYERLLEQLAAEAYKLGLPLETIDTRGKDYQHSAESPRNLGSFLWPDYEETSAKEQRKIESTYSIENFFDYENSQFSAPTSFQSFQRGSAFDTVKISDDDKWEQWGKLVGKNPSSESAKSDVGSSSEQNSNLSGSQNSFRPSGTTDSFPRTKNAGVFAPFHSLSTFPKSKEETAFSSHLIQDSFQPAASHNSFSGTNNYATNNFQNAYSDTSGNYETFSPTNFPNSDFAATDYQDRNTASDIRKSFTASDSQPFFLTPSTAVPTSDKKHTVDNVVDALKIVVDALESTPSKEKIYIAKTSPRPPTSIPFKFSPPDTQHGDFGTEWIPLI